VKIAVDGTGSHSCPVQDYGMSIVEPSGSTSRELTSCLNPAIHLVIFKNFVPTLQKIYFVSITEASLLISFGK
jgi:hypothetical protein